MAISYIPVETRIWRSGIIFAGGMQRLCHYGTRSLLLLYLIDNLKFPGQQAGQIYGLFYGSLLVTAILGGILGAACGYARAGLLGLGFMLAGQVGLFSENLMVIMLAMAFYSIGFGLFDTNLNVAIAREHEEERLRDSAYAVLYTVINIGAAIGPLLFGYLAQRMGPRYSFLLGGIWPLLAYWLFQRSTRKRAVSLPMQSQETRVVEKMVMKADDDVEKPLLKHWLFLTIFALTGIVFATVFDQLGSSVTLLVQEHVRRVIGSFEFSAGYTQSINPLLVIMLGPVFALAMKRKIPNKLHLSRTTILVFGALFLGGGFAVLSLATIGVGVAGDRTTVSWIWVFLAIFLSTVGELMFAPIALSLVSGLGAARHQSFLVGAWTAVNGIGSYLSGTMAGIMESLGLFSLYLGISAVACWVVAILFWITSRTVYMSAIGKVAKIES